MEMKGVFERGGSQEIPRPMATTQLKMEDACRLCNVIEFFCQRKIIKTKRGKPSSPLKLQMVLAHLCKNTSTCLCRRPYTPIVKGNN